MRTIRYVSLLALMFAVPVVAMAQEDGLTGTLGGFTGTFNGFAFGTLNATEGEENVWDIGHVWFIGKVGRGEFEVLTIVAPEGPPKKLHNLQLTWRPKGIGWLDHITIGRTIPKFGWEFLDYRRDTVPTVNYAGITKHMVARDWGVEVGNHVGPVKITTGVFAGKRTGGNIPDENGCCDIYLRGEYSLLRNVSVGLGFRESAVRAFEADLVWRTDKSLLSLELIRTSEEGESFTEWVFLGTRELVEGVRVVGRYEHLREERRTTVGVVIGVGRFIELKFEENFVVDAPNQFLSQLVFRW